MKLSVIVPSIRPNNLLSLFYSIKESFSDDFEMIVVSPYNRIPEFHDNYDVKYIESHANPTVCQQLGLIKAQGDYVCFAWDDGTYEPKSIDNMFNQLEPNTAISGKYIEGDVAPGYMSSRDYYVINNHDAAYSPYITNDFLLLNTGLIHRETLVNIGGFDCRFESTGISAVDMAIRLQLYGTKVVLSEDVVLKCTWTPGNEGDHGPIHDAVQDDLAILHKKYRQPKFSNRIIINIDNWKDQPGKWERRFGN